MKDTSKPIRRPTAFAIDPEPASATGTRRAPASFGPGVEITPDEQDPFLAEDALTRIDVPVAHPRKRRFSFARIAVAAFGLLLSLALGLWVDSLIRDLFTRADWLGYLAIGAAAVGILAFLAVMIRELSGLWRLDAVQALKQEVIDAGLAPGARQARLTVGKLVLLLGTRAETARGRARLKESDDDVIDGPHLIELAERELLSPLDRQARAIILASSKRVSIVTAVSPRALVDIGYVVYEAARMIRSMAELYGGRPGTFGMLRLMRDVIAHLAVTGSIAVGDSLIQQVLGQGLASKLSARLGEGVINGLMTARIGIAAMDLCRPMPFRALKRPGIGDFLGDLTPAGIGGRTNRPD